MPKNHQKPENRWAKNLVWAGIFSNLGFSFFRFFSVVKCAVLAVSENTIFPKFFFNFNFSGPPQFEVLGRPRRQFSFAGNCIFFLDKCVFFARIRHVEFGTVHHKKNLEKVVVEGTLPR